MAFSKIITIRTRYTPQEVFNIFSSGAIAGYLNQECYSVDIDDDYRESFKDIVKDTFIQQADDQGNVELIFHRIYLVAVKA
ncbi:MAG: hypothetical protein SCH39_01090 [Methanosarcinales archaeon]|nr:hypothetical protein [ANME-2 cluster archaeon]MDF1531356.1 hypothetical protein [ANME-2 cluster archaeon]MDW7774914.1 hypothetical protein [Methanosarcinales archaeon]